MTAENQNCAHRAPLQPEALAKARIAYQDFLALCKDADPDLPVVNSKRRLHWGPIRYRIAERTTQGGHVTSIAPTETSISKLILWPALITLAITILRLLGELQHWSAPWFKGSSAIVGISWLPILFGPYFAMKLAARGEAPPSYGKAFAALGGALALLVLGVVLLSVSREEGPLAVAGYALTLVAAFVPRIGWPPLSTTLLAYAFAARIPVLIIAFLAMQGRWGTHYDAVSDRLAQSSLWARFLPEAFLPQMFFWVGYTVILGTLLGEVSVAIFGRKATLATPR